MIRSYPVIMLLIMVVLLSSCFKEDDPITPHPAGNNETDTIPMTQNYKYQVYFDLGSATITGQNLRTNSDLGFECSADGWQIRLNSADFMKAADLGIVPFGQAQDTSSVSWSFDKSDGNPDSLAIGSWFTVVHSDTLSNHHVYAINRGFDENGINIGISQVIFDSLKNGTYYFRFADINGGQVHSGSVKKDPTVNYIWYSFNQGGSAIENEPASGSYDLLFTQYTTMLYTDIGEPYPYLVTGVISNQLNIGIGTDTVHSFEQVTLSTAKLVSLSPALDRIGYDWKYYSFETGAYTVRTNLVYIIRNAEGFYYKLRFVGFYNTSGEKGYPVIEYQLL
jgi:hypothetical protein